MAGIIGGAVQYRRGLEYIVSCNKIDCHITAELNAPTAQLTHESNCKHGQ